MVLQSLLELYENLSRDGIIEKPGWSKTKISYGLVIDERGIPESIIKLKTTTEDGKKEIANMLTLPIAAKKSINIVSNFLYGTSSYIFGHSEKNGTVDEERNKKCFEAAKKTHLELLESVNTKEANAIKLYFKNLKIDNILEVFKQINKNEEYEKDIFTKGANIVIMPLGHLASDHKEICEAWDEYCKENTSQEGMCLVTGKKAPIAVLHPYIKGIKGGQSQGTSLVSFNADSFESFGKRQGFNAPVSDYAAFGYSTALNYLLSHKNSVAYFGDTTVVYWTKSNQDACQDIISSVFGNNNGINQEDLNSIMHKLSRGQKVDWKSISIGPEDQFYILGLSANSARVSIRFFLESSFGEIAKNIEQYVEDMNIDKPAFLGNYYINVKEILEEMLDKNSNEKLKKGLVEELFYSIFSGKQFPALLYNKAIIKSGKKTKNQKLELVTKNQKLELVIKNQKQELVITSVIKAYLIRKYQEYKGVFTMSLNTDCREQPYVLGRLFAVLESIQYTASDGTLNSTIRDKFFASASSTPATVFPLLINLSQKHLKKIKGKNKGAYIAKQKEITDLLDMIDGDLLDTMTLKEKGIFQLGYYQQTSHNFSDASSAHS